MDTARTPRGVLPRPVARVLFVLGGAVLATVVGWLISAASASATGLPSIPLPHDDHIATNVVVPDVVAPLVRLPHVPGRAAARVPDVTSALGSAVTRLPARPPAPVAVVPPRHVLPATPTAAPVRTSRATGDRTRDRAASATVADVPPPAHAGSVSARSRTNRSPVVVRHLSPRPQPTSPAALRPWSPMSVPGGGSGGGAGTPGCAGVGFGTESAALPAPRLRVLRVVTATAPPVRHVPGRQPGTTPD